MSGYGSPPPPGTTGGESGSFEEKLAKYGFQPEGFEKISTTQARATGLAMQSNDFLKNLEDGEDDDEEEDDDDEDSQQPVKEVTKTNLYVRPDPRQKTASKFRRYGIMLFVLAIIGAGAAIGVLTATGTLFAAADSTDSPTSTPTRDPTVSPTRLPTSLPTTVVPTRSPVPTQLPTKNPTISPSESPSTSNPTASPTPPTNLPTTSPTREPTPLPTFLPTRNPTRQPTPQPTPQPTNAPTFAPLTNAELKAIMASRITLLFGWRDSCASCTSGPAKQALLFDSSCTVSGGDSNCINSGGITYGGINTDGTVNDDDRFYMQINANSLSCGLSSNAACATGNPTQQAIHALGFLCVAIGWRDSCNGCNNSPSKLSEYCVDSSLSTTVSGTGSLSGSINTDGSVNGDDNFYARGYVHPSAPSQPLLTYVRDNCVITFGWRDSCNGCSDAPAKRGTSAFNGGCSGVVGSDSLCVGSFVSINTDGDVNGDDKFYMALTCN